MMITKNHSGFSHIVLVLVLLLVLGGVGFAGYKVYDNKKTKSVTSTAATPTEPKKEEPKEEIKLSTYENKEFGFKLDYPKDWGDATFAEGKVVSPNGGKYSQLTFSKQGALDISFVTKGFTSPLDGCAYTDDPILSEDYGLSASRTLVIGWDGNNLKNLHSPDQGNNKERVELTAIGPVEHGVGSEKVKSDGSVLVYKDIDTKYWKDTSSDSSMSCGVPISQSTADQANTYRKYVHYAVNFSTDKLRGTNAHYDARKSFDQSLSDDFVKVLNTLKKI